MKRGVFLFLLFCTTLFGAGDKIELVGNIKDGEISKFIEHKNLEPISKSKYKIYDPYDKTIFEYEGVLLQEFLKAYGKDDTTAMKFSAIDGYVVTISKEEWEAEPILLVIKRDGKLLRGREKGPVRIIYPQYSQKNIDKLALFDKWIWMINRIEFQK